MAPSPSSTISGHQIPGGVRVAAQAHSLHRNAAVFPSPESFDVDRWLDDSNGYSEEQKRERDRWFWAFSSGGRMCVGSNFAVYGMFLICPLFVLSLWFLLVRALTGGC
jgi:cytochrome P450